MPETIEQHFAEKSELEKSSGQIKEEQALKLVREIKEIRGKINKQGESIEDYQRISELAKKIEALYETKERDYETEVKIIVANLRQAWEKGADRDDVAWGLAGVGTAESMKLRKELLEKGADKGHVALGLAGVGTAESMELRKELLKEGADENYIVWSLAGVGTAESMELREELLKKGTGENYIARGLAGVGTTESMKLRKELLEKGADKSDIAYGLAGVNTKEAEEFRREYFGNEPTLFAKSYSTEYSIYDGVICQYGYEK